MSRKKRMTTMAISVLALTILVGGLSQAEAREGRHNQHHGRQDGRSIMEHRMDSALSLTAEQKVKFQDIQTNWLKKNSDLQRETAWMVKDCRNLLSSGKEIGEADLKKLREKMIDLETARLMMRQETYSILDANQKVLAERHLSDGHDRRSARDSRRFNGRRNDSSLTDEKRIEAEKLWTKLDALRREHRKAMDDLRAETHKAVASDTNESTLRELAGKRVDLQIRDMEEMGKLRHEMRNYVMPGRNGMRSGRGGKGFGHGQDGFHH